MPPFLMKLMTRGGYMAPMGDDESGSAGGGEADRGDSLAAGGPDAETGAADAQAQADADAEAARIAAEAAAKDETKDETAAEDDGKKKPAPMIPVERHKAMLDKAREERDALAARLAEHEKGKAIAVTNEQITALEEKVVAKEAEYNKLLVEGEVEKATAAMRDIRALERQMGDLKADMKAEVATSNAVERVRFDTVLERIESAYPALNPDHDDYDKTKVAEVLELQSAYKLQGKTPSAALQKAVTLIMGAETKKQETATTVTPKVDTTDVAKAERTAAATKTAIDAATRTPPSTAKVGADSDKLGGGAITAEDVMKMDHKKFSDLNEETLARLRGDSV